MGGGIIIDSTYGQGTTLTVTICAPPAELPANQSNDCTASCERAETTDTPLAGMRILLAEDGPDNQRLITHHLRKAGAKVVIAENGQEACKRVAEADPASPFDLVLMDMNMPVLDGYGATRQLRESGCTLPIIALTASATVTDSKRCLEAGCDEHLAKPYRRQQLIDLCYQAWQGVQNRQSLSA